MLYHPNNAKKEKTFGGEKEQERNFKGGRTIIEQTP